MPTPRDLHHRCSSNVAARGMPLMASIAFKLETLSAFLFLSIFSIVYEIVTFAALAAMPRHESCRKPTRVQDKPGQRPARSGPPRNALHMPSEYISFPGQYFNNLNCLC